MSGKKYNPLVSNLAQVKALGASGSGTKVWLAQRFTAIALIPLCLWVVYNLMKISQFGLVEVASFFANKINVVLLSLFIYFALYHSMLGVKEIIEDYIHCTKMKFFLIVVLRLFTVLTGAVAIFGAVYISFLIKI